VLDRSLLAVAFHGRHVTLPKMPEAQKKEKRIEIKQG
jgi:hypothetical protein